MKKGTGPETYKYLVVTKSESVPTMGMEEIWKRSAVYFCKFLTQKLEVILTGLCVVGREIDYIIDGNYSRIELENLYSPLYLSNHVNMPQDTHVGSSVTYSQTEAKLGGVVFSIDVAAQGMEDLQPQLSQTTLQGERWVDLDRLALDRERISYCSIGWFECDFVYVRFSDFLCGFIIYGLVCLRSLQESCLYRVRRAKVSGSDEKVKDSSLSSSLA